MSRVTAQEINRLFGPYRPDWNTNVRHHAVLRKALEFYTLEQLVYNGRLVRLATDALPPAAREHLQSYITVYDIVFFKRGNDYRVRNAAAWPLLQAQEQSWHDWIVVFLGRPRPAWALEALPGLQRVRVAAPAPAPFPHIAGPPPAKRAAPVPRAAAPVAVPRLTAPVPDPTTPRKARLPPFALPTPPPSSPAAAPGSARPTHTRTFSKRKFLGTIEISDDEDDERPVKKTRTRFSSVIDLT
ncbi:hypothetical protein GGX14DRAFT_559544 [Mycena pura]|uniref:Uncharacterized protein n=1 Tax=Mycena pura TaxID=153505 RepID=A0AAD6YKK6_9AGAR|nr:hypothetical protein GGX14DRAFT_559544 [Mycena pura]